MDFVSIPPMIKISLDKMVPIKKYMRGNQSPLMSKDIQKVKMSRTR